MNITLLVGLPGSGKKALAERMWIETARWALWISEPRVREELPLEYRNRDMIIDDSLLCHPVVRAHATKLINETWPDAEINWIYFEADIINCIKNVDRDTEKLKLLNDLYVDYSIPLNARTILKVRPYHKYAAIEESFSNFNI
jgi:hypothetical protein